MGRQHRPRSGPPGRRQPRASGLALPLGAAHVWETRVADRTYHDSACPYHMGVRVHPAESLAAYYPWLALEWHPTRNALRPDRVTRASARAVVWRCELGHEWSAAVYQRTLSGSGCPHCYRQQAAARSKAGKERARRARDETAMAELVALHRLSAPDDEAV